MDEAISIDADVDFNPDFASCSVESLLNVPMRVIFRETNTSDRGGRGGNAGGSHQKKYILSKGEVSTLLRVSMLSSEIDAILVLASDALDRSQKCKAQCKIIKESNKEPSFANPYLLRALLPILKVHIDTADAALAHATCEEFGISRILNQLEECADDLGKFAEQNHNMADQLDCYMAPGKSSNALSNEKRAIAEMEEVIAERIEGLMGMGSSSLTLAVQEEDASASNSLFNNGADFISMSDLCEGLFSKYQLSSNATPPGPAVARGQISESQQNAAEALQFMLSDTRGT